MSCPTPSGPSGETLVLLSAAAAIQIAQGRSADDLGVLAAFFTALADNLALLALRQDASSEASSCQNSVNSAQSRCASVSKRVEYKNQGMESGHEA